MLCTSVVLSVSADVEPNDTFFTAEEVVDGTYYGSVSSPGSDHEDDDDYYMINVPSSWDLKVSLECTGPESDSHVNVRQYESFLLEETDDDAIRLDVKTGQTRSGEWYNLDTSDQDVYLYLVGDGDYTLKIETVESVSVWWGIGICTAIVILVIVVIILIIVLILKKSRKQEPQGPAQPYPQPPQYPQYPPYGKVQPQYQSPTPSKPQYQSPTPSKPQYQSPTPCKPQTQTQTGYYQRGGTEARRDTGTQFRADEMNDEPPPEKLGYVEEK